MIGKTISRNQGCGKVRVAVKSSPSRAATMTRRQPTLRYFSLHLEQLMIASVTIPQNVNYPQDRVITKTFLCALQQLSGSAWTGAMTYAFIQAIERGHGTTYGSLLNAMRSTVGSRDLRQLTKVESLWKWEALIFSLLFLVCSS